MRIEETVPIVFGLVPSRRQGRSLGINNVPPPHARGCRLAVLAWAGADRSLLEPLVAEDRLRPVRYRGYTIYLRRLPGAAAGAAP
jgi:hypothetical protein